MAFLHVNMTTKPQTKPLFVKMSDSRSNMPLLTPTITVWSHQTMSMCSCQLCALREFEFIYIYFCLCCDFRDLPCAHASMLCLCERHRSRWPLKADMPERWCAVTWTIFWQRIIFLCLHPPNDHNNSNNQQQQPCRHSTTTTDTNKQQRQPEKRWTRQAVPQRTRSVFPKNSIVQLQRERERESSKRQSLHH